MRSGKEPKERFSIRYALFPTGYYASNSIYQGYISLYYTRLGFSNGQLGVISAATALAALIFQPIWGMLGDRVASRRRLLAIFTLSAACILPLAGLNGGFAWQIGAAFFFYTFFCTLLPLGDTILLASESSRFGLYRLAGGASFATTSALFGLISGKLNTGGAIWCTAAMLALTSASALLLPNIPVEQKSRQNPFVLLRNQRMRAFMCFLLPLQMTMGYFYTFYAPWFQQLGGSETLLGLGYLLSAASEAPYLLFSGRIYRRFGAEKPMLVAALIMALRWFMLGITRSSSVALLSQLLHGGGFIVLSVSMANWISDHVPPELRASGQALLNMLTFGLARISGNLLGGFFARRIGRGGVFLASAALCALSFILFTVCETHTSKKPMH